jgi:hypothetical protein
MKTRRLTKKYKNKRNKKSRKSGKSRKIKNKSRKRILKGGARPGSSRSSIGVIISRGRGSSRGSRAAPRPSSRDSIGSNIGISKLTCCDPVPISYEKKILDSINNFPASFDKFYDDLCSAKTGVELVNTIASIKEEYINKTTIQPQGAYLNITGLKLVNFWRDKYNKTSDPSIRERIKTIISLLDQHGMSHGVRKSDLEAIRKQVDPRYFECYKKLYDDISTKLFRCGNGGCYPVSTSAISLYCRPKNKQPLNPIYENP